MRIHRAAVGAKHLALGSNTVLVPSFHEFCIPIVEGVFFMGQVGRLIDIVARLSDFDEYDTIYAAEPWMEDSDAMVATPLDTGRSPPEAVEAGFDYFLEIHISIEVIEGWIASLTDNPSLSETCQRLIEYATNDA